VGNCSHIDSHRLFAWRRVDSDDFTSSIALSALIDTIAEALKSYRFPESGRL
jgi:hypothetical protein